MHDWVQSFTCVVVSVVVQIVIVPSAWQTAAVPAVHVGKHVCETDDVVSARSVHDAVNTAARARGGHAERQVRLEAGRLVEVLSGSR